MFAHEQVLPIKDEEGYTCASNALIARSRDVAHLLPSELISELIIPNKYYSWLPISLTETGPYKDVHYFSHTLGIKVIRPEDLISYFNINPTFLKNRDNEWLVGLYKLFESVPYIFNKSINKSGLEAEIVRTTSNRMIAPYRKSESSYFPNVFLPTTAEMPSDLEFVHPYLFEKCHSFFENVLRLKTPNAYEHFVKSLEKRYKMPNIDVSFEDHYRDIRTVIRYLRSPDYEDDMKQIVRKAFCVLCYTAEKRYWVPLHSRNIRFPKTKNGLDLVQYNKGIAPNAFFIDLDAYKSAGISFDDLRIYGIIDTIFIMDEYAWYLSIDMLEDALLYISQHANSENARVKSQVIFKSLLDYVAQNTDADDIENIIHTLNNEGYNQRLSGWNGKWIYTESGELVSHKSVSKHDLNQELYGKVSLDSRLYEILGFMKWEIDIQEAIIKDYDALSAEKKRSFFEIELEHLYHITPDQLRRELADLPLQRGSTGFFEEDRFEFPSVPVKNWDSLRKHVAQILAYASPVKYEAIVRDIRVSRSGEDVRAYLRGMYRVNSSYQYACQLCHNPFSNFEACQLEINPDVELDPMNLCLCPNCATSFRATPHKDRAKLKEQM